MDELAGLLAGGRPNREALDALRGMGAAAAAAGVPLSTLVDQCMRAAAGAPDTTFDGVRLALAALCTGYENAEREALRQAAEERQAFVEDLLQGRADPSLVSRFGLRPASDYVVAVARARQPYTTPDRGIEEALVARFGSHNVLVACRDGLLVCVAPGTLDAVVAEFTRHIRTTADDDWRVGVGRPQRGPGGIAGSFGEACEALSLGDRLRLAGPVLRAADLLVFPVLLRDRAAIEDLVSSVLGPLRSARGGAEPLLATLEAIFAVQGNHAAAARRLGITTRAVTYRIERIRRLTGFSPSDPTQRFTLETAVIGARLLATRKPTSS